MTTVIERGGDIADRAEAIEHITRDDAVREVQHQLAKAGCADCNDCANPIDPERRAAIPSATRCLNCQRRFEMQSAQYQALSRAQLNKR